MDLSKGYGFQKGKSGNSQGRPKGSQNWSTLILQGLKEKVDVKENDETKKLNMAELAMRGLIRKCIRGDSSAVSLLLTHFQHAHSEKTIFRLQMGKDLQNGAGKTDGDF